MEIHITTYDAGPSLVDWEIDTGGEFLDEADKAAFVAALAATCSPCHPKIVETFQNEK